jgi:hypothetical protein
MNASAEAPVKEGVCPPLKFRNGDDCLNDIIEDMKASGTFPSIPNKEDFYQAILDSNWSDDGA